MLTRPHLSLSWLLRELRSDGRKCSLALLLSVLSIALQFPGLSQKGLTAVTLF